MLRDPVSLTVNGRLFQSVGFETGKLRGPELTEHELRLVDHWSLVSGHRVDGFQKCLTNK